MNTLFERVQAFKEEAQDILRVSGEERVMLPYISKDRGVGFWIWLQEAEKLFRSWPSQASRTLLEELQPDLRVWRPHYDDNETPEEAVDAEAAENIDSSDVCVGEGSE